MTWPIELICVVLLISAIISSLLAFHAWQRRRQPGALWLALLMVAVAVWSMAGLFEIIIPGVPAKILWSKISYLGIATVAPFWFLFALAFTGRSGRIGRGGMLLLWSGVAAILGLVFTNELHGLVWSRVEPFTDAVGPRAIYHHGPAIWLVMAYLYGFLIAGAWPPPLPPAGRGAHRRRPRAVGHEHQLHRRLQSSARD